MKIVKRQEVEERLTWDLTHLVQNDRELEARFAKLEVETQDFVRDFSGKLAEPKKLTAALCEFRRITQEAGTLYVYAHLAQSVDMGSPEANRRYMEVAGRMGGLYAQLSFLESETARLYDPILEQAKIEEPKHAPYLDEILRAKPHMLSPETESVLAALDHSLDAPYEIYQQSKLVDISFEDLVINGKNIPLSYNIFEGIMESEGDTKIRRAAYQAFYDKLADYQHTTAACYNATLQRDKVMSQLRGFDNIYDYLLFDQQVDRELHDRQINLIMNELAPHMRKYASIIKRVHGLDKMTYADLKLNLDTEVPATISIEEAKNFILEGLSAFGEEYQQMVERAFEERWIDFANNEGKSTGAFCSSPYGVHSYILINWTGLMEEVLVLAHELGHAGHNYLAQQEQSNLTTHTSLYFVEAPSTANEIIMETHLLKNAKTPEQRRWVLSQIIARTYYHNFVTHLLEAAYQQEVYRIIDAGGSVQASTLNDIFRRVLETFWGPDVEIPEGSERTWMRQPHYYRGLYPYTYSAGLTIGTQVAKRITEEGEPAIQDWLKTLRAGGSLPPVELAKLAGVDITTDQPLRDTIAFIGETIDELDRSFGDV